MLEFLENQLKVLGFTIIENQYGMLVAKGPKFRIRAFSESDTIQIGFEETFDRWANSTDYEARLPNSVEDLNEILEVASTMKKCHYCSSWKTSHVIANRPCCNECYESKHKKKNNNGKR